MKIFYLFIAALVGGLITIVTAKVLGKRSRFLVERHDNDFKQGQTLPIGANLRVLHGPNEITNFRISRFSIKNESTTDFENVKIRVWSSLDRFIIHDSIRKIGFIDTFLYHPEFTDSLQPDENNEYSDLQIAEYNSKREYLIPTFNRFETVQIVVVSTTAGKKTEPDVWVEIPHKGIKVDNRYYRTLLFGAPNDELLPFILFFSTISIVLPAVFFQNPWIIAIIAGLGSGSSSLFSAGLYRIKKWLVKKIAD